MDYLPKTVPFSHQARIFQDTRELAGYALFWEQGTGKTKPTIDTLAYQFLKGTVDCLIVVAPAGVHLNWVTDELPAHLPDRVAGVLLAHAWKGSSAATKWHDKALQALVGHPGLSVLTIPYDSFVTDRCKLIVWKLLKKRKVMFVADEGINIKTPSAKRSISITAAAQHAPFRRLLNGTPIAVEPWDVYQQMKFTDKDFWRRHGLDNLQVFKTTFGIWKKIDATDSRPAFDLCVAYRRLDELQTILKSGSDRVLKEDVLDLPPKLYSKARFDMSPKQQKHYDQLKDEFLTWLDAKDTCATCGGKGFLTCSDAEETTYACDACEGSGFAKGGLVTADLAITRMLRLQQVASGYLPNELGSEEPFHVFEDNPRLDRFMIGAEALPHSCITWCRFQKDAELICEALKKAGKTVARYDGTVPESTRNKNKEAFQKGDVQFFVANPAAIATGVTLTIAKTTVYYTNSYNLIHRLQSEDRNHRIGQDTPVNYIDLIANQTVDEPIVEALRAKVDVSRQVTGDRIKEWI